MIDNRQLLTPSQVAEQLSVTVGALAQMRHVGSGPPFVKITGHAVRYLQSDVDRWVAEHTRTQAGASQ